MKTKKTLLTAFFLSAAASVVAAPLNTKGTSTGAVVEVGADVNRSDVKNSSLKEKNKADVSVRGNYNTQFGASNWIGGAEVAVKPLHRTIDGNSIGKVKQKVDASASYIQGYRLTNDVVAYGKVGYHYGRFKGGGRSRTNMSGLGYGVGAKYAVTPNVEVGAEWEQTRYKKDNLKIYNNSYMATVDYRFKRTILLL